MAGGGSRSGHFGPAAEVGFDLGAQPVRVGARLGEQARDEAVGLVEEGEQEVLPVDLGMAEAQRFGLGVLQGFLGLLGQSVHVHGGPPVTWWALAEGGLQLGDAVQQVDHDARGRRS